MSSTQPKQERTVKVADGHQSRPAVVAYDPHFPQKTAFHRNWATATTSLVFSPYFPKIARQVA